MEIKVGDFVKVDRGLLKPYYGILKTIVKQGWYEYGTVETDSGEIKSWDSDVHKLLKVK